MRNEVPAPAAEEDDSALDLDSSEDASPQEASPLGPAVPEIQAKPERPLLLASVYALDRRSEPTRVSTFRLQEERLPGRVLISDDGESVVLLGEGDRRWDALGSHAVVLYRSDGSLVRSLSLEDLLTSGDLREAGGFSSRPTYPWASTGIDEVRGVLVLQLERRLPDDSSTEERLATLEVDLETGLPLQPKRDLLPQPRAILSNVADEATYTANSPWDDDSGCTPSWDAALSAGHVEQLSNAELRAHAIAAPLPGYTELGRKARVTGTVVIELQISERGNVEAACFVKSLPMALGRNALFAAQRWRFRPIEAQGKPVRAVGRLAFEFGWFLAEARSGAR